MAFFGKAAEGFFVRQNRTVYQVTFKLNGPSHNLPTLGYQRPSPTENSHLKVKIFYIYNDRDLRRSTPTVAEGC